MGDPGSHPGGEEGSDPLTAASGLSWDLMPGGGWDIGPGAGESEDLGPDGIFWHWNSEVGWERPVGQSPPWPCRPLGQVLSAMLG